MSEVTAHVKQLKKCFGRDSAFETKLEIPKELQKEVAKDLENKKQILNPSPNTDIFFRLSSKLDQAILTETKEYSSKGFKNLTGLNEKILNKPKNGNIRYRLYISNGRVLYRRS